MTPVAALPIQDILNRGVSGSSLGQAFLARSQQRGRKLAVSILTHAPVDAAPSPALIRSVRQATRWAAVSVRTLLLFERRDRNWRMDRPPMLFAVPVLLVDSRVWGAVVAVGPASSPSGPIIHHLERLGRELGESLSPRPGLPNVPGRPSLRQAGSIEWTPGAAYDVLLHELRTPLGAASHALDVVVAHAAASNSADEEVARMLRVAQLGAAEAQSCVRRFSQLGMIHAGSMQPTIEAVSVMMAIERAIALLPDACVHAMVADEVPPVAADHLWLTQVLTNLLENAVRYTRPPDPIRVVARRVAADHVLIAVIDNGPGIPLDQQADVFRPYVRGARGGSANDLTSQGLGLSIARYFVTAMGGDIWLESDGQKGTTFSMTLPTAEHDGRC